MLTLVDIYDRLKRIDEVSLLEMLNISSEDIIERFSDLIEDAADRLEKELDDEECDE